MQLSGSHNPFVVVHIVDVDSDSDEDDKNTKGFFFTYPSALHLDAERAPVQISLPATSTPRDGNHALLHFLQIGHQATAFHSVSITLHAAAFGNALSTWFNELHNES